MIDESKRDQWLSSQQENRARRGEEPELPLHGGGGGGTSDGMEPRIAKLEALMEATRADLAKLASVPADLASVKERLQHISTKSEVRTEVDSIVDRAVKRVQVTVGIAGGAVALISAALHFWK